jgi:hypothetical protein
MHVHASGGRTPATTIPAISFPKSLLLAGAALPTTSPDVVAAVLDAGEDEEELMQSPSEAVRASDLLLSASGEAGANASDPVARVATASEPRAIFDKDIPLVAVWNLGNTKHPLYDRKITVLKAKTSKFWLSKQL